MKKRTSTKRKIKGYENNQISETFQYQGTQSVPTHLFLVFNNLLANEEGLQHDHISIAIKKGFVITYQESDHTFFPNVRDAISNNKAHIRNQGSDHLRYASQLLASCKEMIAEVSNMYIANNDLRMNSIMQRLTVVSTIFIPLTFLAGVWGMNFPNIPEFTWENSYFYAWGVFLITGIVLWWFFMKRKWM